jgi:PleD family two-component response regulator
MSLAGAQITIPQQHVGNKKILVVDDEDAIRTLLIDILKDGEYDIFAANNGAEAIQQLGVIRFDLVITDMVMRKANGLDVLLASRKLDPDRPVIIVTGFPSVATAVKLVSLGASDYITKPFNIDLIKITVAKVLAQREFFAESQIQVEKISQAIPDSIVEPYNFMLFNQMLEREVARSRRRSHNCSLMIAEIDGFEEAILGNATKNWEIHLKNMFDMVKRYTQAGDIVGRTDPDQLSVILPETSEGDAYELCQKIYANEFLDDGFLIRAVTYPRDGEDVKSLVRAAKIAIQAARSGQH